MYGADDPGGFGPALQVVTDQSAMLMDSVTVLLHRLGVAYVAIMNPVFRVRRDPERRTARTWPRPRTPRRPPTASTRRGSTSRLSPSANASAVAEAAALLPNVLADARQVAVDSAALNATLVGLANALDADHAGHFPGYDRRDVAALLRWLADGHFVLLGYQRCAVQRRPGLGRPGQPARRAATAHRRAAAAHRSRRPAGAGAGHHAELPALRRVPVHRGGPGEVGGPVRQAIEHRFVGLFTVAATNANVLEIPLISRRVNEALALSQGDPSHPGQLMLDIIQTIPRSELFALSARDLLDMAMAVVDLGSRRRTLLFLRADQLAHFVSCLVYLPRDRYTTAVRLEMQDILVRELGGVSIEYTARVSESPWAVVHFTVRLPDGSRPGDVDTSLDNETRIQNLLTEAARTWGDRLIGAVKSGAIDQADAEHYCDGVPRGVQAGLHAARRHRRHRDHRRAAGQFGQAGLRRRRAR